ncbi:MAG: neutral/alkaline non-lysosomal ceramidase N-terminal domain-containing protein [Marinilabiliales bacterium]|nr:neutral/alkaline non-lysosomal ceramidase N-terminal domain-containing protein [Marinilabiliales bacterium]
MKKFLKYTGGVLLLLVLLLMIWVGRNLRDQHPDYKLDLKILNNSPAPLSAGFAALPITPAVPDRWDDKNKNAEFDKGESYTDGNGNGKFDQVWIAGFGNNRPANGIHDDVWARAMVLDDGKTRLAVVVLDAIGFMNNDVIDVRNRIPKEAGITYAIITSTHTHEGPDLLGLWGPNPFNTGVNPEHMEYVKNQAAKAIEQAVKNLRPARLSVAQDLEGAKPLVIDTRKPEYFDSGLRMIQAIDKENGKTLGTLIAFGDHPETLWSDNLLVSSDFPHYVREGIEKGVFKRDSLVKAGVGGVAVYMSACVGGLMTTHPRLTVKDPFTGEEFKAPTFEKAAAQGKTMAWLALKAMDKPEAVIDSAAISVIARTIPIKLDNNMFALAAATKLMNRGTMGWMKMKSEVAVAKIGPISIVTIPGELYPEILNGTIEAPVGQDFAIAPVEVPCIRDLMPGKYKFMFGLANDEIGYIIPKSQWDAKPPFTYGKDGAPYGEVNSMGPETAPDIHKNIKALLEELR